MSCVWVSSGSSHMGWRRAGSLCCVCVCGTQCMRRVGVIFGVFSFFVMWWWEEKVIIFILSQQYSPFTFIRTSCMTSISYFLLYFPHFLLYPPMICEDISPGYTCINNGHVALLNALVCVLFSPNQQFSKSWTSSTAAIKHLCYYVNDILDYLFIRSTLILHIIFAFSK